MDVILLFDHQPGSFHVFPEIIACFEAILSLVRAAMLVDPGFLVQDRDNLQAMSLADFIVVGVMPGRDFQGPSAEFTVDVLISNYRDFAPQYRNEDLFTDIFLVAFILGMYGNRRIA